MRSLGMTLALCAALSACAMPSGPAGSGAPLQGSWQLVGAQTAPSTTIEGTIEIEAQDGELITGRAGWDELDSFGVSRRGGGPLSGRVIGDDDVDFDISVAGVPRRHVGRLRADTMEGSWVQLADGRSGTFRAVRSH